MSVEHLISILAGSLVTVLSQRIGYLALAKKLEAKADKADLVKHEQLPLEDAHSGVLR
jgi:hypothetical protein